MRRKMDPQTALGIKIQGAIQQTASRQGQYPFIITPLTKKEPASLAKRTQPTKRQLLATITSKPMTSENDDHHNPKTNKNVRAVRTFTIVPEPALEIAARRARDEEIVKKQKLNKHKSRHNAVALFQVIQQDYSEQITQSIHCLVALIGNPQFSSPSRKIFTQDSILQYFRRALSKCSTKTFFNNIFQLLKLRICEIAEELQQSFPQKNGKAEITSLMLKTILQFQEYLPPQDYSYYSNSWHINPIFVSTLLSIPKKQFKIIKNLFLENYPKLTYISNEFQIHDLVLAYYILLLKNKFEQLSNAQMNRYPLQSTIAEFKARKLKVSERKKNEMIEEGSITLSELYANVRQVQKSKRLLSSQEIIDTFEIFQEIEQSNIEHFTVKHPKIQMLADKYQTQARFIVDKCRRFIKRKKTFIKQYGSSLSKLKDEFISRVLIQKPYCSYEQVFNNVYHQNALYIERSYFEGNVHRLLKKEAHYQQLRYLEKVFKGILQRKEKANVLFIDRCSLIEGRESNVIMTVSLAGALYFKESPDSMHYLKEVKEILKTEQPSVVLLFDDEFPFSELEETEEAFIIRKTHSLCFLPRVSLTPNPCMTIANTIRQMLTEQCSLEEALQTVLKEFGRVGMVEIALKEWEKTQRLAYPDNPQGNQQSEANKDESENSNIEEGSDFQNNQDEDNNEEAKFLRQSKQGFSSPNPKPLMMENLQELSASDLQLALTKLLQLHKSSPFPRKA